MLIITISHICSCNKLFIGPVVDCGRARALSHCHVIIIPINLQRTTAVSPTSTMSLHDELSHSMNSLDMIPEATSPRQSKQSSPQPQPTSADLMVSGLDGLIYSVAITFTSTFGLHC